MSGNVKPLSDTLYMHLKLRAVDDDQAKATLRPVDYSQPPYGKIHCIASEEAITTSRRSDQPTKMDYALCVEGGPPSDCWYVFTESASN